MAVLGTALVALMWSGVIVAGAAVGNLVAGNQLGVTGANLAVLIGVLWATSFLALVVMDATRQALHRRKRCAQRTNLSGAAVTFGSRSRWQPCHLPWAASRGGTLVAN